MMIRKLCEDVSKCGKFVLYGAGYLAHEILNELSDMDCQPLYCVVTNLNQNSSSIDDISVYSLEEKAAELQRQNILVVIAVSEVYTREIIQTLKEYKIENIVAATDYLFTRFDRKSFEVIYQNKEFEWYIARMEAWHKKRFGTSLDDISFTHDMYEVENRIIFVVNNLSPRIVKIAKALQEAGKEIVVLLDEMMKDPVFYKFYHALEIGNIRCIYYDCFEELLFLLASIRSRVIHIFSSIGVPYMSWLL